MVINFGLLCIIFVMIVGRVVVIIIVVVIFSAFGRRI